MSLSKVKLVKLSINLLCRCDCPRLRAGLNCENEISGSDLEPRCFQLGFQSVEECTNSFYCVNGCNGRGICNQGFCSCNEGELIEAKRIDSGWWKGCQEIWDTAELVLLIAEAICFSNMLPKLISLFFSASTRISKEELPINTHKHVHMSVQWQVGYRSGHEAYASWLHIPLHKHINVIKTVSMHKCGYANIVISQCCVVGEPISRSKAQIFVPLRRLLWCRLRPIF